MCFTSSLFISSPLWKAALSSLTNGSLESIVALSRFAASPSGSATPIALNSLTRVWKDSISFLSSPVANSSFFVSIPSLLRMVSSLAVTFPNTWDLALPIGPLRNCPSIALSSSLNRERGSLALTPAI